MLYWQSLKMTHQWIKACLLPNINFSFKVFLSSVLFCTKNIALSYNWPTSLRSVLAICFPCFLIETHRYSLCPDAEFLYVLKLPNVLYAYFWQATWNAYKFIIKRCIFLQYRTLFLRAFWNTRTLLWQRLVISLTLLS